MVLEERLARIDEFEITNFEYFRTGAVAGLNRLDVKVR